MKKIFLVLRAFPRMSSCLILSVFMLLQGAVYAVNNCNSGLPPETAILKLHDDSEAHWKESARLVDKKDGMVEFIPLKQTAQNCEEIICIQYNNRTDWDKNAISSLEDVINHLRKKTFASYSDWKIIEKNKDDIIYEWILHKPYKDITPQHEVARMFFTNNGLHRVGFTRKNGQMNSEEREKWVKLLKENASIVSFQEGAISPGLSLVEKLKDSVVLGSNFQNWKIIDTFASENGYTYVCYIPPTIVVPCTTTYVAECLECITMPTVNAASLDQFFEADKQFLENEHKKIKFQVLEKSASEIIYTYCYPTSLLQCNVVARAILTDRGYYSISYRHGLIGRMQKEEILKSQEKLKSICIEIPRIVPKAEAGENK